MSVKYASAQDSDNALYCYTGCLSTRITPERLILP